MKSLESLLKEIRACTVCEKHLPLGANPIVRAKKSAKLLIVGQAPGTKVHQTGIPWNDPSGDRLRDWLDMDRDTFYNEDYIAIVPMGFCYPGKGKSGDLPPREECAPLWHEKVLNQCSNVELVLLIGMYSQNYYLESKSTLTETVRSWKEYGPLYFPLPHPSPRNRLWVKKNDWFEKEVVPILRKRVKKLFKG